MSSTAAHWDQRWSDHDHAEMGWFQREPQPSLEFVTVHTPDDGVVIDVGGGASFLVDHLVERGFQVTVLDIAAPALEQARQRLGDRGDAATWVHGDVTEVDLSNEFDTWHDRAVLHFLLDDDERAAYVEAVRRHLRPGGHVVVGTFAPDGPTTCSGLPVRRHSVSDLQDLFGPDFTLVDSRATTHVKPDGSTQSFVFAVLRLAG